MTLIAVEDQIKLEESVQYIPLSNDVVDIALNDGELSWNGHPLNDDNIAALSGKLGIPQNYLQKCSPMLAKVTLQEFIGKQDRKFTQIVTEEKGLVSLHDDTWYNLPITRVVDAVQSVTNDRMTIVKCRPGISHYNIFIAAEDAFDVADGSQIHFGINIVGSLDGHTGHKTRLSYFRPTCTNGAYYTTESWSLPRRSVHDVDTALEALKDAVAPIYANRRTYQSKIERAARTRVTDPIETIRHMISRHRMSPRLTESVMSAWDDEPMDTMWGVMNAFTRAANTPGMSDGFTHSLWSVGADSVNDLDAPCPVCGTEHVL